MGKIGNYITIAVCIAIVLGMAHILFIGSPENKKFFDDCYYRRTARYSPGDVPDYAMRDAVAACSDEQRQSLGLK